MTLMHHKTTVLIGLATVLTACVEPELLTDYRPVVDAKRTNIVEFDNDLNECVELALGVEADYKKRQEEELARNLVAGLIAGALTGAVVGAGSDYQSDYVAIGAAAGMASGAEGGDYNYDLVNFGPRRIVDRCMVERGYSVLNDIGRG